MSIFILLCLGKMCFYYCKMGNNGVVILCSAKIVGCFALLRKSIRKRRGGAQKRHTHTHCSSNRSLAPSFIRLLSRCISLCRTNTDILKSIIFRVFFPALCPILILCAIRFHYTELSVSHLNDLLPSVWIFIVFFFSLALRSLRFLLFSTKVVVVQQRSSTPPPLPSTSSPLPLLLFFWSASFDFILFTLLLLLLFLLCMDHILLYCCFGFHCCFSSYLLVCSGQYVCVLIVFHLMLSISKRNHLSSLSVSCTRRVCVCVSLFPPVCLCQANNTHTLRKRHFIRFRTLPELTKKILIIRKENICWIWFPVIL